MTLEPCIFCRGLDVARTREHVVQAAFGGSLTLPTEVCGDCNAAFSPLDKDLVEHVNLFVLGKVSSLLGFGLQEDAEAGVQLTARLGMKNGERGLAVRPPQLFQLPDGAWRFQGPSLTVLEVMRRELSGPTPNVSELVDTSTDSQLPVALAIVRTGPGQFLVRGPDVAKVRALANSIREHGLSFVAPLRTIEREPPQEVAVISIPTSFPVGQIARCLAKVALDYLCSLFTPSVALNAAFDPLRQFARYGEGSFVDFVTPAMLNHKQQEMARGYSHPDYHALVINQIKRDSRYIVAVQVILYGRATGIVRLSNTSLPLLPLGTWRVTYFNHAKRTFEHIVVPDDGLRCFVNIEAIVPGAGGFLKNE